jgi:RNA polymerase primary sigma factor
MTLEEVGKVIGVTKERVRQIQNKALAKIRSVMEDGVLRVNPRSEAEAKPAAAEATPTADEPKAIAEARSTTPVVPESADPAVATGN